MQLKHNLLILGSQNAKEEDQTLSREEVRPVQILNRNGDLNPINFFNQWGQVGVSSIAWDKRFKDELFVSVNHEIRRLNVISKNFEVLNLGEIGDIHDIHFLGRLLWISNTEFDEAVAYDPVKKDVIRRISLDEFRLKLDDIQDEEKFVKVKDRFHCNQVFKDYHGDLCVLIHTINGWLFYRVLLEKFVKKQGDGGIINLDKKEVIPLKLQSPHSIRKINGEYWVQDSGDLSIKIFNRDWKQTDTLKTGGFGRGVDFSKEENVVYVGLSATRKRYLKVIPTSKYYSNRILITTVDDRKKLGQIPIPNIEQLDNVYILNEKMKTTFEDLDFKN